MSADALPSTTPLAPDPLSPDPLSPSAARAARQRVWAFLQREHDARRIPDPLPPANAALDPRRPASAPQPARRRFAVHEIRRIPVSVSAEARRAIVSSSATGRIFPQALSEILGQHPAIGRVRVDLDQEPAQEPTQEPNQEPAVSEGAAKDTRLLVIVAEPVDVEAGCTQRWTLPVAELAQLHPETRHVAFNAVETAQRFLRLYVAAAALVSSGSV